MTPRGAAEEAGAALQAESKELGSDVGRVGRSCSCWAPQELGSGAVVDPTPCCLRS